MDKIKSRSYGKNLIKQGGLYLNNDKVHDLNAKLRINEIYLIKIGKKVTFYIEII